MNNMQYYKFAICSNIQTLKSSSVKINLYLTTLDVSLCKSVQFTAGTCRPFRERKRVDDELNTFY